MTDRALSFGSVASAYERYRPGYPDELVDAVLAAAGRPVQTALEIGAGTGKATRVFAAGGIAVTATEPDAEMLAELRRHVPGTVVTVQAAFEDLPTPASYDLVFAAASLHWTTPAGRWHRVASMLAPGGVFACFGGRLVLADADVEQAARAARSPDLGDDDIVLPALTPVEGAPVDGVLQWPGPELVQSGLFGDVHESTIPVRGTLSAGDYVGHLSTVSAYLVLPPGTRQAVLTRVLRALPERVDVTTDITLHTALRR